MLDLRGCPGGSGFSESSIFPGVCWGAFSWGAVSVLLFTNGIAHAHACFLKGRIENEITERGESWIPRGTHELRIRQQKMPNLQGIGIRTNMLKIKYEMDNYVVMRLRQYKGQCHLNHHIST